MVRIALSILLLLSPLVACGQEVKLPAEVKGDVAAFLRVPADTTCPDVQWYVIDAGLNLFPVELLKDTKTAVVSAAKPGRYRLLAYGAKGDKASPPSVCLIVVGDAPPIPPPGPDPGPEPGPVDPLVKSLQAAFDADKAAGVGTLDDVKTLAEVYRQGAGIAISDLTLNTVGAFFSVVSRAGRVLPQGRLDKMRSLMAKELDKVLPVDPGKELDNTTRRLVADKLNWAATLLSQVK